MLDILYFVFIAPLEYLMRTVFDWGLGISHSYGVAIVVMSLVVNTAVLPIYNRAEAWQEQERALKKGMQRREEMLRRCFKGQERFAYISALYREFGYSHTMTLKSSVGFLLQIPFFIAAYHLLSNMTVLNGQGFWILRDLGAPDALLCVGSVQINVMPLIMTAVNFLSAFVYTNNLTRKDKVQLYSMAVLFLVLLYDSPVALTFYWTLNNIYSLGKNIVEKQLLPFFAEKFARAGALSGGEEDERLKGVTALFWPSVCLLVLLAVFYFPITFYASDPRAFEQGLWTLLRDLLLWAEVSMAVLVLVWLCLPMRMKKALGAAAFILAALAVFYGFLFVLDYGVFDETYRLQHEEKLYARVHIFIDIAVLIVAAALFAWGVHRRKTALMRSAAIALTLVVACITGYRVLTLSGNSGGVTSEPDADAAVAHKALEVPPELQRFFTFSKTDKNVVVVMLDMFTGGNVKEVLAMAPELATELDGFVYYPDTMSPGSNTVFSKPTILGGEKSLPWNINRTAGGTIEKKHNKNWLDLLRSLQEKKFRLSVFENEFQDVSFLKQALGPEHQFVATDGLWSQSIAFWKQGQPELTKSKVKVTGAPFLLAVGAFKVLPNSLKKNVYTRGRWKKTVSMGRWRTVQQFSEIDSYARLSVARDDVGPQFKFLINETTHVSWALDEKCRPCEKGTGSQNELRDPQTGLWTAHLLTEKCVLKSLAKWIAWLKSQGIYDNTQLIFVSDHGRWDSSQLIDTWTEGKGWPSIKENPSEGLYPLALHALLMVKDYNSRGQLREDPRARMAIWDVPAIVRQSLGEAVQTPWTDGGRVRRHVVGDWQRNRHGSDKYKIGKQYRIEGTIFNKKNWIEE